MGPRRLLGATGGLVLLILLSVSLGTRPVAADEPEFGSRSFLYIEGVTQEFVVPDDVYYLTVHARGGHGGGQYEHAADGGAPGAVDTVLPVNPGMEFGIQVGGYGAHKGAWGWATGGDHGATWGPSSGDSGDGGGGATGIFEPVGGGGEAMAVVAGGGGGAGGDDSNSAWGGNGGDGGLPAEQGFPAYGQNHTINTENRVGGCGGCRTSHNGYEGEGTDTGEVVGGGGGGGGAGYKGGGGGNNGVYKFEQVDNIGGSGGGGGTS